MSNEQNYMCIIYIYTFSLTWKRSQFPGAEVLSWFLVSYSIFIAIPWQDHSSTIESHRRDRKHGSLALHRDLEGNWKGNADTVYCNVLQITGKNWNRCFFSWFLYTFFCAKWFQDVVTFSSFWWLASLGLYALKRGWMLWKTKCHFVCAMDHGPLLISHGYICHGVFLWLLQGFIDCKDLTWHLFV